MITTAKRTFAATDCGKRVVRRLRQEDLAAQIQLKGVNMERDSISRIEIGTRFVSDFELKVFAEVLGVSVQWLLGIDE